MEQINTYEAKTQLSRLLERVQAGEEIVIARAGHPVARLVPLTPSAGRRTPGGWTGRWHLADDWDSSEVNQAVARDFEGARDLPARRED